MSVKNKKLSASKYKGRGLLLYQNLWHRSKLTKKGAKLSKYKVKVHSTEIGRPISKYRMLKTLHIFAGFSKENQRFWVRQKANREGPLHFDVYTKGNLKKYGFKSISSSGLFAKPKELFFDKVKKVGEKPKRTFLSRNFMPSPMFHKGKSLLDKKNLRLMVKRLWFFDTAAPIPGVSSLKKKKRLLSTKLRAFKTLQSWIEIYNKKQMKAFFGSRKNGRFSKNWNAVQLTESMYQSNFRKSAFTYNRRQRNSLALSGQAILNGAFIQKLRFVNVRGDLTNTKNVGPTLKILMNFYAPKKAFFSYNKKQESLSNYVFGVFATQKTLVASLCSNEPKCYAHKGNALLF
uniref:Orf345 n=1 Tax=Tetradesmus obliquus TaxID=3088 RepID=Q9MGK3_TETOB|nr:orf345 [Tetradesmus obliquus]